MTKRKKKYQDYELYPFAIWFGKPISKMNSKDELYQLTKNSGLNIRMRAIARRRLIELGHITRYSGQWLTYIEKKKLIAEEKKKIGQAHFLEDNTIQEIEVGEVNLLFQGQGKFGTFFVYQFIDESGLMVFSAITNNPVRYKKARIKATVIHSEYNDQPVTNLKKIRTVKIYQ